MINALPDMFLVDVVHFYFVPLNTSEHKNRTILEQGNLPDQCIEQNLVVKLPEPLCAFDQLLDPHISSRQCSDP